MSNMLGADVNALRQLGSTLAAKSTSLDGIAHDIHAALQSTPWSGRDAESFNSDWSARLRPLVANTARALSDAATALARNADEQERASEGGVGSAQGDSSLFDNGDRGKVSEEVAKEWSSMTDTQRRQVLQTVADEYADRNGLPRVTITFEKGMGATNGSWDETGKVLRINADRVSNPDILHTIAHESRHAAQYEAVRKLNSAGDLGFFDPILIAFGLKEDPFKYGNVTRGQTEAWRENFKRYISPGEDYNRYLEQPVEKDARNTGREFVEGLTPEQLASYRK